MYPHPTYFGDTFRSVLLPVSPQRTEATTYPHPTHFGDTFRSVLLTFVLLACVAGIVIAAAVVFILRQHAKQREKERLAGLGPEGAADSTFEYQVLGVAQGGLLLLKILGSDTRTHAPCKES